MSSPVPPHSPDGVGSGASSGLLSPPRGSGAPRKVAAVSPAAAERAGLCRGGSVPLWFAETLHKEGNRLSQLGVGAAAVNNARPCPSPEAEPSARLYGAQRALPRLLLSTGAQQKRHFSIPVPGSRGTVRR